MVETMKTVATTASAATAMRHRFTMGRTEHDWTGAVGGLAGILVAGGTDLLVGTGNFPELTGMRIPPEWLDAVVVEDGGWNFVVSGNADVEVLADAAETGLCVGGGGVSLVVGTEEVWLNTGEDPVVALTITEGVCGTAGLLVSWIRLGTSEELSGVAVENTLNVVVPVVDLP